MTTDAHRWRDVDAYFRDMLVREDEVLVRAREASARTTAPNIEVSPALGSLLHLLARMSGARRVLEFGTLAGYSTTWLARAVGPEGCVVTLELEPRNAAVARETFEHAGVADRVDVVVGPALVSAHRLVEAGVEPFDLVFIDADKPNNPHYLDAALRLTRPGAVIVVDNVVRGGAVVDAGSEDPNVHGVRAVTEAIAATPELDATALQTVGVKGWDGIIVAVRKAG